MAPPTVPRLRQFDIALAVPLTTLNAAFAALFAGSSAEWTADVDVDHGLSYQVRCGAPRLSVNASLDDARMTFRIIDGTWQGGRIWNEKTQAFDTIMEKLAGGDLSFSVAFSQISDATLGSDALSVRHLYADLTAIKAVDTTAHDVDPGDPTLSALITAFVRALQKSPAATNGSLLLLTTKASAQPTPATVGPLEPTTSTYSVCGNSGDSRTELLSLMMCARKPLPIDATARTQQGPWTPAAADAALVLSGRRVLETLVKPTLLRVMGIDEQSAAAALVQRRQMLEALLKANPMLRQSVTIQDEPDPVQFQDATDDEPAHLVCRKTMYDDTSDRTLFYFRQTGTSVVDASVVDGNIVIRETGTFTADCYGQLGRYKLTQQLGSTTTLVAKLVDGGVALTQAGYKPWTGDIQNPASSGLVGLAGRIASLFDSMPKNLVLGRDSLTAGMGTVSCPFTNVSLPGSETFAAKDIRIIADALVVGLRGRTPSPPEAWGFQN